MKILLLPSAVLGLTTLLTACGGGENGPASQPSKFTLTVNVTGVPSAPVKIVNTTSKDTVFDGSITGSKTFGDLNTSSVLSIVGGAVGGRNTPGPLSVTLDSEKVVTLAYKASTETGTPVSDSLISGKVLGTDLQLDTAAYLDSRDPFSGPFKLSNNVMNIVLSTLVPGPNWLDNEFQNPNCMSTKSIPDALSLTNFGFMVYGAQGDMLGYVSERLISGPDAARPHATIVRLYADRSFDVRGTCEFQDQAGVKLTQDFDLKLVRGWNTLVASGTEATTLLRNAAPGNRTELRFTSLEPRVNIYLDPEKLTFTDSDTVSVSARITQVGNYSGTVNLSTGFPGLSIEPSSVTLKPLPVISAQGLAPQSLSTKLTFKYTGNERQVSKQFVQIFAKTSAGVEVGSGYVFFGVDRSTFYVDTPYPNRRLEAYAGESIKLQILLGSYNGFTGPVAITLEGAPAGVTVPLTTGTSAVSTSVDVPLTVAANVPGGDYEVMVVGTSGTQVERSQLTLRVQSKRTSIGPALLTSLAPAPNGDLWGAQGRRLIQIRGAQVMATLEMPDGLPARRTQVGPDGSVWATNVNGKVYHVNGGVLKAVGGPTLDSEINRPLFGIDRKRRVWTIASVDSMTYALHRVDLVSGEDVVIKTAKIADTYVPVLNDPAGDRVVFMAANGYVVKVDTSTGLSVATEAPIMAMEDGQQLVALTFDRQGQLWAAIKGQQTLLKRINLENMTVARTVQFEKLFTTNSVLPLAVENEQLAWTSDLNTVIRLNLADGTQQRIEVGDSPDRVSTLSLAPEAGIAYGFGPTLTHDPVDSQYLRFQR